MCDLGEDSTEPDYVIRYIENNSILLTVYHELPQPIRNKEQIRYLSAVRQVLLEEHEGNAILEKLGEAGFDCMHDNFRKGNVTVEMHNRLTDDNSLYTYYLYERVLP